MSWFENLPVQRKLGLAMLFTSTIALLAAGGVFLAVEYLGFRRNLAQSVVTLGRVTADLSTASLMFDDQSGATQIVESLRNEPQIVAAGLYDAKGRLFARYVEDTEELLPATMTGPATVYFEDGYVVGVQPVVQGGRRVGTLYLRASLATMYRRMQAYTIVVLGVLALSIVVAGIVASILRRTLARPILELAHVSGAVSALEDYSLRARQYGNDELGRLTSAFNEMLEKVQAVIGALRESEERFRVMADGAPVLIWLADASRRHVWFNQGWLNFVGHLLEQETDRGWLASVHPDDRARVQHVTAEAFEARRSFQHEYRLRRHDDEYRWVLEHGVPRFGASGEFTGFIGSCIDVSDRRLAEQEATQARDRALAASRAKDEFLAALSHELRTPLNPVLLVASDAAADPTTPQPWRGDFEMIAKHVSLEARLIDDLLDLTRVTRGKLALNLGPANVHAILHDALATVRPELEEKRLRLHLDLGADRSAIVGDAVRLQQVFWNVLKNAVKFTRAQGEIRIETRAPAGQGRLLVRISDTGIGLTPEEIGRIFDAFSQGEHAEARRHQFGGLGLGLAITQKLVEMHAGTIRASSPGRDRGATFEIELPLAPVDGAPLLLTGPAVKAAPAKPAGDRG